MKYIDTKVFIYLSRAVLICIKYDCQILFSEIGHAGFDKYHKIAVRDHVRVLKYWRT